MSKIRAFEMAIKYGKISTQAFDRMEFTYNDHLNVQVVSVDDLMLAR